MFLSRTSHELRTPLNAILGFAQLLLSDLPRGDAYENASLIKSAGDHLLKLIDEVLNIANIEAREQSVEVAPTAINDLLAEAMHYIAPLGKIRDMEIQHHIDANLYAQADDQKLLQVILNILSNALKYGPTNSVVNLRAYQRAEHIIIEVHDEGPGIPDELKGRLFTPFDRLGAEQSTVEGTGLGLALSKKIMLAMDGDIEVADTQSIFSIILKAATGKHMPVKKQPENPNPLQVTEEANSQLHHIVYIEDNLSNKALVEAIVTRQTNFRLVSGSSLHEARSLLEHVDASLLIVDLNLPDGSGETLIKEVNNGDHGKIIPIMVLSADAMPQTIKRVEQLGVKHYLTKPFNIAEFTQHIKTLTGDNTHHG